MKRTFLALVAAFLLAIPGFALPQYGGGAGPTLSGSNIWNGLNTFNGVTDFNGAVTLGAITLGTDLIFDGSTVDAFTTTLRVTDPTTPSNIFTFPDVSGAVFVTSLLTNGPDVANSVWGVSNGLAFGGATGANGFELTLSAQDDPAADVAVTIPNTVASTLLGSTLLTNDVDVANSIWGASNGLAFGGATGADGFELTLSPQGDPSADATVTIPIQTGAIVTSLLTTNAPNAANSVWAQSNSLAFEGATADGNEVQLSPADGAGIITLPALTGTMALGNVTQPLTSIDWDPTGSAVISSDDGVGFDAATLELTNVKGEIRVTDGTDSAEVNVKDKDSIELNADTDASGNGDIQLSVGDDVVNLLQNVANGFNFDAAATAGFDFDGDTFTYDRTTADNMDVTFSLTDLATSTWLTFTDIVAPGNVITYAHNTDSDPSQAITITNGTGSAVIGQEVAGTNHGAFLFEADSATTTADLRLDSDGQGLEFDMTGSTNTTVDFDLSDVLNDAWLTFTDVATATNVVTYTQLADSDPGFTEVATNGTTTAAIDVESGANPRIELHAQTATNLTRFSVDALQGGRFEYLNSGNTAQMWTDNIAFTDAATINLMTINIGNGQQQSGQLSYTAVESGGGIIIANRGVLSFACVNEADAEVCTSGSPAGTAFAEHSAVDGDSGATMACTPALTPGTNAVVLSLSCNTSSGAGGTIYWKVESEKDATSVTVP